MIRLDTLSELLAAPGPYATAYLDADPGQGARPAEVAARWRALRDSLAEQGADAATLDAMEAVAGRHTEVPGRTGRCSSAPVASCGWTRCCPPRRGGRSPGGRRCRT